METLSKVIVVKMGGVVLNSSDTTVQDIVELQRRGRPLVVVHGGGNMVTEWLKRQGVATKFVRGERVTDKETLAVAVSVLAGLANKQFVAVINSSGGRAIGISGVDGGLIQARVKNEEMGYVGSIVKVNPESLNVIINAGFIPIVSPIGLNIEPKDELLLNINGDPVAGEIA
ncbi:MAG: acetylglutamate kinase, partial [Dehalococcoidales bacterium]|nr:acetylglutamate kinase [Dehalococcoidales bacterium]